MRTRKPSTKGYKSGFCITKHHDRCQINYGNEVHPVECHCRCHKKQVTK